MVVAWRWLVLLHCARNNQQAVCLTHTMHLWLQVKCCVVATLLALYNMFKRVFVRWRVPRTAQDCSAHTALRLSCQLVFLLLLLY